MVKKSVYREIEKFKNAHMGVVFLVATDWENVNDLNPLMMLLNEFY